MRLIRLPANEWRGSVAIHPCARGVGDMADHLGYQPLADARGIPLPDKCNRSLRPRPSGDLRADGAPPFVRGVGYLFTYRAINFFRPLAKEVR